MATIMTANQDLFDEQISHNVRVEFLKNGIVKRMLKLLQQSDDELSSKLILALEKLTGTAFSIERIERQLASIYDLNKKLYAELSSALNSELKEFAEYETHWQQESLDRVTPAIVNIERIGLTQVYAAAVARPFNGRLLSEWYKTIEESARVRVRDAVRLGVIQNETTDQIVKRIRGTKSMSYKDGLIEISKKDAQSIVLTAVAHTQDVARESVYQANSNIIKYEIWNSTLDTRVCPRCAELDGQKFELGKGVRPPIHFRDRCVRIPILKSWRDLGFNVDELPPSTRASMDGQVPEDTTYSAWLRKQSDERQDEVLGKERGRIYRKSGLPLERFINREGKYYTLAELKKIEATYQ